MATATAELRSVTKVPIKELYTVAFCDPASGSRATKVIKRVRARAAIVIVGQDQYERVFTLHAWAKKVNTDKLIEKIFELNDLYKPRKFGIESNAMQTLFVDAVRREADFRGIRIPVVPVQQPTDRNKDERIEAVMSPILVEGRAFIQDKHVELQSEVQSFPMAPLKDLLDALATCCAMLPSRPAVLRKKRAESARKKYLREHGVSTRRTLDSWQYGGRFDEITERPF